MSGVTAMRWGIKQSLMNYVEGLPDGKVTVSNPALREGAEFVFPSEAAGAHFDLESLSGELVFEGKVILSGHWGGLRIELATPRIVLSQGSGRLQLSQLGLLDHNPHFTVANLSTSPSSKSPQFEVSLAEQGRILLGEQYETGALLSPLMLETSF